MNFPIEANIPTIAKIKIHHRIPTHEIEQFKALKDGLRVVFYDGDNEEVLQLTVYRGIGEYPRDAIKVEIAADVKVTSTHTVPDGVELPEEPQ